MTVIWLGRYTFNILEEPIKWSWIPEVGGLYVFARQGKSGLSSLGWQPLYIGQATQLHTYLPTHRKLPAARHHGMTALHYMRLENETSRLAIEKEMIQCYQPILNVQHRWT